MKITRISAYQVDLPIHEGSYKWAGGKSVEVFDSTIEQEDYYMCELIQRSAESGVLEHVVFGRNEPALHHYHNCFRTALGLEPLQEYCVDG